MSSTTSLKILYKKTIPYIWGYQYFCSLLKFVFTKFLSSNWHTRLPVKPGQLIKANLSFGTVILTKPERCSIAKKLYWTNGEIEPVEDRNALEYFIELSRNSDFVLDIGSNSGIFSLASASANPRAKVFAFDILPEAFHILIDNLIINDLTSIVTPYLIGVGKTSKFKAPFKNITSEMPTSLKLDENYDDGLSVNIEIKTLDNIFKDNNIIGQACIKIDVEGFEGDIFKNSENVLEVHRPYFLCEVLPSSLDYNDYDKLFIKNKSNKFLITDSGLIQYEEIKPNRRFKDWLFIPIEKSEIVRFFLSDK